MKLRSYQIDFCDSVEREWKDVRSTVGVMFTGLGKTVCFAEIIKRMHPKRSMVIAHREELIFQARDKIFEHTGLRMEVEMGGYRASTESGLFQKSTGIVSSIQTLTAGGDGAGRMSKFDPMDFGLLVVDEFHHAVSASYRRAINYFLQNPELKVLGVTATPDRADEEALGQVAESVAFEYEAEDAIKDGWLVPVVQQFASIMDLDFANIRTTAGDLNGADLDAVMTAEKPLYGVVDACIQAIGNKRTIAFCSSVNHAQMMSEIFNRYRSGMSAWICGKTDKNDRKQILSDFRAGKIQVVCNCGVLTEGFDDPSIEVVAMARPTKSRSLYAQMLGRGTRPLAGVVDGPQTMMARRMAIRNSAKPSLTVLDFCGNSGKHKLVSAADVLGGNYSDEVLEAAVREAKKSGKPVKMEALLEDEEARIKTEREERRLSEEARRARLTAKATVDWKTVDPFDLLQIRPTKTRGWDSGKQFTEKQAGWLRKLGVDPATCEYSRGKQLMAVAGKRHDQNLCTVPQLRWLKRLGVEGAESKTFSEARSILDTLFNKGKTTKTAEQPF